MNRLRFIIALLAVLAAASARAQLALPGAATPSPVGTVEKPHKPHAAKVAGGGGTPAVASASLAGLPLMLDGSRGLLQFSAEGKSLRLERLILAGETISDPRQECRVEVVSGTPIETKDLGRPDGLNRLAADIPACPLQFDVLDGAVLAPARPSACLFTEADCKVDPSGLWGEAGAKLAVQAKALESARARAESAMVANFKALSLRLKEREKVASLARDQAAFSSTREETCRAYAQEAVHSFCATRLTEARAALLKARADELPPPKPKGD
jgi:hypothetical protein